MRVLERLLAPLDSRRFFEETWTKSPVTIQGNSERFADLFDGSGLDRYLNGHLRFFVFPAIQLYFGANMGGARIPPELFMESIRDANRQSMSVTSPAKVRQLIREGATLMLHSVHDGDPSIKRFAEELQHVLGETLRVDLFYTPPQSSGVHAHFDREDVFVLQLEGTKEWHLSNPTVPFPLEMPDYAALEAAPTVPDEVVRLSRGDVLYLPRGHWHATHTSKHASLHLSVRVACRTGIDLLHWAVGVLESECAAARKNLPIAIRESAPYGYDPAAIGQAVRALRDAMNRILDAQDLATRFNRACIKSDRPANPYQLAVSPPARAMCFARPATQRTFIDCTEGRDTATLVAWGREIELSRSDLAIVDAVLARTRFTGDEIVGACPAAAWADIARILSLLLAEGLIFQTAQGARDT